MNRVGNGDAVGHPQPRSGEGHEAMRRSDANEL
jgi:hypothetical protein